LLAIITINQTPERSHSSVRLNSAVPSASMKAEKPARKRTSPQIAARPAPLRYSSCKAWSAYRSGVSIERARSQRGDELLALGERAEAHCYVARR
jgi:hypothetical protein